jgi:hypothetical protein
MQIVAEHPGDQEAAILMSHHDLRFLPGVAVLFGNPNGGNDGFRLGGVSFAITPPAPQNSPFAVLAENNISGAMHDGSPLQAGPRRLNKPTAALVPPVRWQRRMQIRLSEPNLSAQSLCDEQKT